MTTPNTERADATLLLAYELRTANLIAYAALSLQATDFVQHNRPLKDAFKKDTDTIEARLGLNGDQA